MGKQAIIEKTESKNKFIGIEDIIKLKQDGEIYRLGITFRTSQSVYIYDTGTGKAVKLDYDVSPFFEALFDRNKDIKAVYKLSENIKDQQGIIEFINNENLLLSISPKEFKFIPLDECYSEENLHMGQLVIELTGNCNMRCKYCIYHDYNECNRNFNTNNISFQTAKKAIDYVYEHRNPEILAVTFYGGEPLLNFGVMKQCIDYCLAKKDRKNVSFSLTTNLTLMTEEIADYLAQIPNLSMVLSLDGPKDIHDKFRVLTNNKPSFDDAIKGLKNLAKAMKKYNKISVMFNCVLTPPYTLEKFEKINNFFESLEDFMPERVSAMATHVSKDTMPESYLRKFDGENLYKCDYEYWSFDKSLSGNFIKQKINIYSQIVRDNLSKIHFRNLSNKPYEYCHHNGCCVPGVRRLYVCTDGTYKVCERIGESPTIGNVDDGLNIEKIKKYYLNDYEEQSSSRCSKCWASNLCDVCYAECYTNEGIDIQKKDYACKAVRFRFRDWLSKYYYLLECKPELVEEVSKLKIM